MKMVFCLVLFLTFSIKSAEFTFEAYGLIDIENSVVTKNVPEKSVMAGIPARRVGDATKGFKPYAVTDEDKE